MNNEDNTSNKFYRLTDSGEVKKKGKGIGLMVSGVLYFIGSSVFFAAQFEDWRGVIPGLSIGIPIFLIGLYKLIRSAKY